MIMIKKKHTTQAYILGVIFGVIFIPQLSYAAWATNIWHDTNTWVSNGAVISAQKVAENFEYLLGLRGSNCTTHNEGRMRFHNQTLEYCADSQWRLAIEYLWNTGEWGGCHAQSLTQTRTVTCVGDGTTYPDGYCNAGTKPADTQACVPVQALEGVWYTGRSMSGTVLATVEHANIDFTNYNPAGRGDDYSVRITGYVQAQESATHTFYTYADDGVRLWVNNTQVIDNWVDQGPTERSGYIWLTGGNWYPITIEHYENGGGQRLRLQWATSSMTKQNIPESSMALTYPGGNVPEEEPEVTECSDGIDNDGNGLIDMADVLGCTSPEDDEEEWTFASVICTELNRQGFLPEKWLEADSRFGARMPSVVMDGYHVWAKPVVRMMQKSERVTKVVNTIAQPWAQEMAHIEGVEEEGSVVGKVLMVIGIPISALIGIIVNTLGAIAEILPWM
jgi:hypothetical protein